MKGSSSYLLLLVAAIFLFGSLNAQNVLETSDPVVSCFFCSAQCITAKNVRIVAFGSFYNTKTSRNCLISMETLSFGESVTSIPNGGMRSAQNLKSVVFHDAITNIGENAFTSCSKLSTVNFSPQSTLNQIGANSFLASGLSAITIPHSVLSLGQGAFQSTKLRMLEIPSTISQDKVGGDLCRDCQVLTTMTLPSTWTVAPPTLCWGCASLDTLNLPASLTTLGDHSFAECPALTCARYAQKTLALQKLDMGPHCGYSNVWKECLDVLPVCQEGQGQARGVAAVTPAALPTKPNTVTITTPTVSRRLRGGALPSSTLSITGV